jgi:hypothetical protein
MKKFLAVILMSVALLAISCEEYEPSSQTKNAMANEAIAQQAITAVTVPVPQYYLERKTVKAWFENWDQPNKISYVYIFVSGGACIGYFVVDGKPISNRSYLTPEEGYYMSGAVLQTPSLDGTYGEDLPGIRFKDSSGVWHEFGGTAFSYHFSDWPVPSMSTTELKAVKN